MTRVVTRVEFAQRVRQMVDSKLGAVRIADYASAAMRPYRHARITADVPHVEAVHRSTAWMALAVAVTGYLAVHTSTEECYFGISVTIDLDEAPAVHGADVAVETVLADEAVRS